VLLRFSGTEPVLRLTVEADTPEKSAELLAWLRQFVALEGGNSEAGKKEAHALRSL
jgi:phosphomannomutase